MLEKIMSFQSSTVKACEHQLLQKQRGAPLDKMDQYSFRKLKLFMCVKNLWQQISTYSMSWIICFVTAIYWSITVSSSLIIYNVYFKPMCVSWSSWARVFFVIQFGLWCTPVQTPSLTVSYPMALLRHEDEELSQVGSQPPHISGVGAAALSQAVHQGDVGPHFVHHTSILTETVTISVTLHDLGGFGETDQTPLRLVLSCLDRQISQRRKHSTVNMFNISVDILCHGVNSFFHHKTDWNVLVSSGSCSPLKMYTYIL